MALTDYTFKLGDTGEVLNDDISGRFVDVTRVTGLDSAPYRTTERDWEGNDGGFLDAEYEKGRQIVLTGTVYSDDDLELESYLDSLKSNFAPSRTLVPLYFKPPGEDERMLLVKPLGCRYDWTTDRGFGSAEVQFSAFAEDPRIYTSELKTLTVSLAGAFSGGFAFNFGFNLDFGSGSVGLGANAHNSGNRSTPPVFTIHGPSLNPRILNDTTGDEMHFIISLASDETLVVDTKYRTVRLDGVTNRRHTLAFPTWFHLAPGDNYLRYLADVATATSVTVEYRDAWR